MTDTPTTFWQAAWDKTKTVLLWCKLHLLAPGAALFVVLVGILLASMGMKQLQIGGLLGRLFGKKEPDHKVIDVANSIDPDRVDPNGNLIQPGTPDSKGDTQVVVVPIKDPGLFSNPNTVVFTPPGKAEPIEVTLPDGVQSKDVDKVVVVQPGQFVVTVKDDSGVSASHVDDLLKKYGM